MQFSISVSSTFADLARHRELVREAISKLEYRSKAMELFGALPDTPTEECLRLVRSTNVYVGIFGMRYGSIDPSSGKSLTQLEYEEAQSVKIPSLSISLTRMFTQSGGCADGSPRHAAAPRRRKIPGKPMQ